MFRAFLPLREGWIFIGPLGGGVLFTVLKGWWFLFIPLAVLTMMAFIFFRNPPRHPPEVESAVISPADGRIITVERLRTDEAGWKVSIFMSVWDVHVNRSPVDATVKERQHRRGRFFPAYRPEASERNEQNKLVLETSQGKSLTVVQVAGILARRILCRVGPGDSLRRGQVFGAIILGSRVDLYLPEEAELSIKIGDRVKAGESLIGFLR